MTILLIIIVGFIIGFKSKRSIKIFKKNVSNYLLHQRKLEYLKTWEGMYGDYEKCKKVISLSFNHGGGHYLSSRRYLVLFREKYWNNPVGEYDDSFEFNEIYSKKMDESRYLYDRLMDLHSDHFSDKQALQKAKGEWKRKFREKRLTKLIDN